MKEIGIVTVVKSNRRKPVKITRHGSFTLTYDKHITTIAIVRQDGEPILLEHARWDTGSNITYIDRVHATNMEKEDLPTDLVSGVNGTPEESENYTVTLTLPGGIEISDIMIGDLDLSNLKDCEAIIGLDVIRQGKFVVEKDKFSFEA